MNKYQKYSTEDFLSDQSFQKWVSNPTSETDLYWQTLLAQYPELNQTVYEAKLILVTIQNQELVHPSQSQIQKIWKNINILPLHRYVSNYRWFAAAASVVLLLALGVYFNRSEPTYYAQSIARKTLVEKVNNSSKPMVVILADGSVITLEKGAKLSYPPKFKADKREVYLLGNAFFEIAKNPNQPFLVYANATVTKVLGTSFWINAPENQADVNVIVKTGKVSVYAEEEFNKLSTNPSQDAIVGVVLTPNQQAKYNPVIQTLEKSVVPQPAIVIESKAQELIFDEVPISDAFKVLEKTYGIKIVYDEETLAKCLITTSFTDEPLFDKLSILCKATGATYEVIDGQIIINSKSCK